MTSDKTDRDGRASAPAVRRNHSALPTEKEDVDVDVSERGLGGGGHDGKRRVDIIRTPCRECRSVKVKCDWGDGDSNENRCVRCKKMRRDCTPQTSSVVSGPELSLRSYRLACSSCKKRKRACVGGIPPPLPAPVDILAEDLGVADRTPSPGSQFSTACQFCQRNGLVCRLPGGSRDDESVDDSVLIAKRGPRNGAAKGRAPARRRGGKSAAGPTNVDSPSSLGTCAMSSTSLSASPVTTMNENSNFHASFEADLLTAYEQQNWTLIGGPALYPGTSLAALENPMAWTSPVVLPVEVFTQQNVRLQPGRTISSQCDNLPSSECLNYLLQVFWDLHALIGRNIPLNKPRFVAAVSSPTAELGPLLWLLIWGSTVLLDSPINIYGWTHPELTAHAKSAIKSKAQTALLMGLQSLVSDLATLEAAIETATVTPELLSRQARRIVPMLQALVLGMHFYEKSGGTRNMISLVSLLIRLGALAATALRDWVSNVVPCLKTSEAEPALPEDQYDLDRWMQIFGVAPPFPNQQSLISAIKSPAQLNMLSEEQHEDVILLTEFAACHFYAYGVDAWASDLLGTPLQFGGSESDHMPVPFDSRGFEGESAHDPYLGPVGLLTSLRHSPITFPSRKINPPVPFSVAFAWIAPEATQEQRNAVLMATVTDCFRVGPHFIVSFLYEIERRMIQLRFRAKELGFVHLYPDACQRSFEIRSEVLRLRGLLTELLAALPREALECEMQGDVGRLFELTQTCPTWPMNVTLFAFWIFYHDSYASVMTPPPDVEPEAEWFGSQEGLEAATSALRTARLLRGLLDIGYDVNSGHLLSWFHTKVDRLTRIVFLHLQHARRVGLETVELFQDGLVSFLRWFHGLGARERYCEWIDRLNSVATPKLNVEAEEAANFFARMVISAQDKALSQFRGEMDTVEGAIRTLL